MDALQALIYQFPENILWASAILGTTLFVLRIFSAFIAGFGHDEFDIECESLGVDGDYNHVTPSLNLLTLHSLSGFFMMFGWVGLACVHQLCYSHGVSLLCATTAGLSIMIVAAFIVRIARRLESKGDRFSIQSTLGLVGVVYQQILPQQQGKIHVVVNGMTRELLARSHDGVTIHSFVSIKVVSVIDHETVLVVPLN